MNNFNWQTGFTVDFDKNTGLSKKAASTLRNVSDMRGMYSDEQAEKALIDGKNPMVYEYYVLGTPEHGGDVAAGTSIVYPGKVGNEYFMTKGHYHSILDTGEVYYCLNGEGYMMIENQQGDWHAHPISAGVMVYVPKGYAHRSINTGNVPLVTFFAFRGDAGHDYKTIEQKGFRKLVVEIDGAPSIIDNPKWA